MGEVGIHMAPVDGEDGHRGILEAPPSRLAECIAMTTKTHGVDLVPVMTEHPSRAEPDLLRSR